MLHPDHPYIIGVYQKPSSSPESSYSGHWIFKVTANTQCRENTTRNNMEEEAFSFKRVFVPTACCLHESPAQVTFTITAAIFNKSLMN